MNDLLRWLDAAGAWLVMVNVFIEQLGLPVPAYPLLVVAGGMSAEGKLSLHLLLAVSVLACLAADLAWYAAGRRWGSRVLGTLCRLSLTPDTCVRQTENLFVRMGAAALLVAKFVPGFGTLAVALSGCRRMPLARFLALDAIGATLYVGVGLWLGWTFHDALDAVVQALQDLGRWGLLFLVAAFGLFIAAKLSQRQALKRELGMPRATVGELVDLLQGADPVVLDVRSADARERDGAIPGSVQWPVNRPVDTGSFAPDRPIVVYCACPNEASAAIVARKFRAAGFSDVRPLQGGLDAWRAAGLPVRTEPAHAATSDDASEAQRG